MDYSDSNFALEVSSMDYQNRHKQQFAYRLGEQEEWVKLEGNRHSFQPFVLRDLPIASKSV